MNMNILCAAHVFFFFLYAVLHISEVEIAVAYFGLDFAITKMPREPDIGWQHGTMVGGHRHHVQCNYCHRKMIGGVTRFKKHLAGKRGEIKGCDAVPNEVREIIRKHLAAAKPRKTSSRKKAKVHMEPMNMSTFDGKDTESDESDREMAAARLESLRILHEGDDASHPLVVGLISSCH